MVSIVVPCLEEDLWIVLRDFEQFPLKVLPEASINDFSTVFGRDDEMVVALVKRVADAMIVRHMPPV